MEQKVRDRLGKRKSPSARDEDFLFAKGLDEELRKHGA
jgi:hypothetical protein